MTDQPIKDVSSIIQWKFQRRAQGFITRYGVLGSAYYKQVLPGGLELPDRNPPKAISKQLYDLALRSVEAL